MPTIRKDAGFQTIITTFEVTPGTCQDLVAVMTEACSNFVSLQDGFIGAAIHVNDAQTRIANYTQWQSREHFQALQRSEEMQAYNRRFAELCKDFSPVLYDVVMVADANNG
ncbi:MAG TPA: antibiotic biosynthesis monooxygenase [Aliiroseovarius sp.]|nr:antibiotic biosynthesis monooxygenase [Aliiroseovarius sp.]